MGPHAVGPVLDSGETGPRLLQVVGVHQVEDVTTAQLSGGAAQQELAQRTHPSDAECIIDDHDPVSGGVEQRQGGRTRPTRMLASLLWLASVGIWPRRWSSPSVRHWPTRPVRPHWGAT